ncbi:predicted protein [Nematostella vectensis]|uniref:VWFA domain-containing protein n=1 Tax=Nematostella vectensis TaxID=45351 RepID=A7SJN0_NEMVE|nr:predicted protein [Nematostella vectensis]|eukprot:XP_001628134.1 predicted protein [Nematostella vectensis]
MPPKRSKAKTSSEARSCSSSRFSTLKVTERSSVRAFVEKNKLKFAPGKGFYQLTKPETIHFHKEIVVRRKSDGLFATGEEIRTILNIPKETAKFKLDQGKLDDFDVFVQSTSYNRVLLPDTEFLYDTEEAAAEVENAEDTAPPTKRPKATMGTAGASSMSDVKEIVFSFDTTGSMYPCLAQVRKHVEKTVGRLLSELKGVRISIFAHGDYQDKEATYDTKWIEFSSDKKKITDFVKNVSSTCGYDSDECYELLIINHFACVLGDDKVRTQLTWTPGSQRALVMIGDANPHPPSYHLNTQKINWREEAKKLYEELGVRIYSIQCLGYGGAESFYRQLADITCGWHLKLDQFASIVDFLMAICYREQGLDSLQVFEDEVRGRGSGMNRNLHKLFDTLSGRTTAYTAPAVDAAGLTPVNPSRFQILDVDERVDIRTFVQKNDLIFKPGKGFFEFTKAEKISDKKEVVLVDKVTGDMFTGREACDLIGAGGSGRIKPASLEKWRVFVQSTSYNRVLMPGTGFLYEVDSDH